MQYVPSIYISCTKEITLWESARAYIEYYINEAGELGTKVLKLADSNCHLENKIVQHGWRKEIFI